MLLILRQAPYTISMLDRPYGPDAGQDSMQSVAGCVLQVNVEYNLLDPLLRSTINPDGDVNDATGVQCSPVLTSRAATLPCVTQPTD